MLGMFSEADVNAGDGRCRQAHTWTTRYAKEWPSTLKQTAQTGYYVSILEPQKYVMFEHFGLFEAL